VKPGKDWPRKSLEKTIEKIGQGPPKPPIALGAGIKDVTLEQGVADNLIEFAPIIKLIGQEILVESRSPMWGGTLVRALETEESGSKRRCLQYIYTYTVQRGAVSFFYNIVLPILLVVLAYIAPWLFGDWLDVFVVAVAAGVIALPLFFIAAAAHISDFRDPDKEGFHFRGATWLLIFGALPVALVYYLHGGLTDILGTVVTVLWWANWILLVVFLIGWILSLFGVGPGSHRMDYVPVFVYLKSNDGRNWNFESACWDYYHYQAVCRDKSTEDLLRKGRRVRLIMNDPWHSLSLGSRINTRLGTGIGALLLMLCLAFPIVSVPQGWLQPWGVMFMFFLFVVGGIIVAQMPLGGGALSNLRRLRDLTHLRERAYLSEEKIHLLWNLSDEKAQLVIRTKLQDPFRNYPQDSKTFRDS
jgi:hypothetical protein